MLTYGQSPIDDKVRRGWRLTALSLTTLFLMWAALWAIVWAVDSAAVSHAVVDVRSVLAAQDRYAAASGGYFADRLECLLQPWNCLPGYTGQPFLSAEMVAHQQSHRFLAAIQGHESAGLNRFAYLVVPAAGRPWVARLALLRAPPAICGDSSMRIGICGSIAYLTQAECPESCQF